MRRAFKQHIPAGWRATSLGDELPLAYGKGLPAKSRDATGTFPVYGSAGVAGYHSESLVEGPALIVGRKGNVGMAHLVAGPSWPIDTTYFTTFRPDQAPKFFKYLLDHLDLRSLDKSTAIPSLSRDDYNAVSISVPNAGEQHRIVAAADMQFSRLDAAVASLTRAKANLKRARASVLKAAVEGRLVPTEAALARAEGREYEPGSVLLARILAERKAAWAVSGARGKYGEPVKPETEGLPGLPEGWVWASVDALAGNGGKGLCDGPFGSNLKSAHYVESGPRVVRLQNIGDGVFRDEHAHITEEHFGSLSKHEIKGGDLVIASLGETLPRACIVPDWLGSAIVKADCIRFSATPSVSAQYLNAALNAQPIRERTTAKVHGIGRPRLGLAGIREIELPLPPLAEQRRIVAEVDRRLSVLDALVASVEANLARCARLRQAVLKHAFEGRLVPAEAQADATPLAAEPNAAAYGTRA